MRWVGVERCPERVPQDRDGGHEEVFSSLWDYPIGRECKRVIRRDPPCDLHILRSCRRDAYDRIDAAFAAGRKANLIGPFWNAVSGQDPRRGKEYLRVCRKKKPLPRLVW
jgi:hypothetical protein